MKSGAASMIVSRNLITLQFQKRVFAEELIYLVRRSCCQCVTPRFDCVQFGTSGLNDLLSGNQYKYNFYLYIKQIFDQSGLSHAHILSTFLFSQVACIGSIEFSFLFCRYIHYHKIELVTLRPNPKKQSYGKYYLEKCFLWEVWFLSWYFQWY